MNAIVRHFVGIVLARNMKMASALLCASAVINYRIINNNN